MKETFIELELISEYTTFEDFYKENHEKIYRCVIKIFHAFKDETMKDKTLTLKVHSVINNTKWDTDFDYRKGDEKILNKIILPYFEENNDFETCIEIRDLIKDLSEE